jgi:Spy/CpxP family protein refolding chaperone
MNRKRFGVRMVFAGLIAMALTGTMGGCMEITADTTISEALNLLAQAASNDPTLNQLTVGDLVQGFLAYVNGLGADGQQGATVSSLTSDQITQLEELQRQLDSGEITQQEFAQQVHDLVGDVAPGRAFAGMGMMGGPFPEPPGEQLADQLQLTDDQRQQAEDIFTRLHTDLDALRQSAEDQIKALLTADQLTQLDELLAQSQRLPAPPPGGPHGGRMGPPPPNGGEPVSGLGPLDRFADALQLTDEQKAAIEQIHTDLQADVKARHQQARDEFRAILTADQLAILDQIEARHAGQGVDLGA